MTHQKNKKIGVLYGGFSREREISLRGGNAVFKALQQQGYSATLIDVDQNIAETLKKEKIEVAFLALHGRYGEDGCIQGLLEILKIPYTGSGVLASAVAMDKHLSKNLVELEQVAVPKDIFWNAREESLDHCLARIQLKFPLVIKPSREGSTVGITRVENQEELPAALARAAEIDSQVLIEEFISGREVTVAILEGKALPIVEVVPKKGFYDFESKYTVGATEYFCPASLEDSLVKRFQNDTLKVYERIGCNGVARADFIIQDSVPYFLEINTLPGMTETSLVPKAAKAAGIEFNELVEKILKGAEVHES